MPFVMMYVKNWSGDGDIDRLCSDFNIAASDIDREFGVNCRPEKADRYTILISEDQTGRLTQDYPANFEGPFSEIQFAPFGGPKP